MKKILMIWAIIIIIAVGGLTVIGFKIKNENKPYRDLEKALEKQAVSLYGEKPSLIKGGSKLTIEDFVNNGYSINMIVNGDVCDGYVLVEQSMNFYKYKPYIKCQKYTTAGYNK